MTSILYGLPAAHLPKSMLILLRRSQRRLLTQGEEWISRFSQIDTACNKFEAALTSSSLIKVGHPVDPETKRSEQKITHHVRRASSNSDQLLVSAKFGSWFP
jgi:hypothetical protein